MTAILGMFAKHWTPGRVKTRLAAELGGNRATEIHRLFVHTLLSRFSAVADERILVFDPPESEQEFRRAALSLTTLPASFPTNQHEEPESQRVLNSGWQTQPQVLGDLGQRMAAFFATGLARANRVVLIGSDSPDLPTDYLSAALEALDEVDVVLGPASDGGYYLVGAARSVPPIFSGMAWSTAELWSQTTQRLKSTGCRWRSLPQWYDVDTAEDLIRLQLGLRVRRGHDVWLATLADRLTALVAEATT
jgi:uncharacterized protein